MIAKVLPVGDFGGEDASIQVMGLKSTHFYNVRAIATNSTNFSTLGPIIRLCTNIQSQTGQNDFTESCEVIRGCNSSETDAASVHATRSHFDMALASTTHQMTREFSGTHYNNRRIASGRRGSPQAQSIEYVTSQGSWSGSEEEHEAEEVMHQLTRRLESARLEQQGIDSLIRDEEQESGRIIANMNADRDHLKQKLKEKEETSSDLRKHGNYLDKLNRSAQSKKAAKEKILIQKRADRKKMTDEMIIWDKEISTSGRNTGAMLDEKAIALGSKGVEVAEVRGRIIQDQGLVRSLEEEIRLKGIQIMAIEKNKEKLGSSRNVELGFRKDRRDSEHGWEIRVQATQVQIAALWHTLQQVCVFKF